MAVELILSHFIVYTCTSLQTQWAGHTFPKVWKQFSAQKVKQTLPVLKHTVASKWPDIGCEAGDKASLICLCVSVTLLQCVASVAVDPLDCSQNLAHLHFSVHTVRRHNWDQQGKMSISQQDNLLATVTHACMYLCSGAKQHQSYHVQIPRLNAWHCCLACGESQSCYDF